MYSSISILPFYPLGRKTQMHKNFKYKTGKKLIKFKYKFVYFIAISTLHQFLKKLFRSYFSFSNIHPIFPFICNMLPTTQSHVCLGLCLFHCSWEEILIVYWVTLVLCKWCHHQIWLISVNFSIYSIFDTSLIRSFLVLCFLVIPLTLLRHFISIAYCKLYNLPFGK